MITNLIISVIINTVLVIILAAALPGVKIRSWGTALLMALLGYLRLNEASNCLPTATGARRPAVGGALHLGWKAKRI